MTRKARRSLLVLGGVAILALALGLVLVALGRNITYFHVPSDLVSTHVPVGQRFRLGGLVEEGSVVREPDQTIRFAVTDGGGRVSVRYRGLLPDLFREGQGVVAEGRLTAEGVFSADTVLAKHDERYLPPDVVEALKRSGEWRGQAGRP